MTIARARIIRHVEQKQEAIIKLRGIAPRNHLQMVKTLEENFYAAVYEFEDKEITAHEMLQQLMSWLHNEKLYNPVPEFFDYVLKPTLTKYDKSLLLHRFPNLLFLCKDYFKDELTGKQVYLTTMPMSLVNGICEQVSERDFIIYLSEGILYSVPLLIQAFDKIDFEKIPQQATPQDIRKSLPAQKFGEILSAYMTDAMLPTPETMHERHFNLTVFDSWKLEASLQKTNYQPGREPKDSLPPIMHEDTGRKQRNYYTLKGFLMFILGHEMSHIARNHNEMRANGETFIGMDFVNICIENFRDARPENRNASLDLEALSAFYLLQPFEMQADGDAFAIIKKYITDHDLAPHQRRALIKGAIFCLYLIEITDHVKILMRQGIQALMELSQLHRIERNILLNTEHPTPSSRLEYAVDATFDLTDEDIMEINEVAAEVWANGDKLWRMVSGYIIEALQREMFKPGELFNADLSPLFANARAMGHMSF